VVHWSSNVPQNSLSSVAHENSTYRVMRHIIYVGPTMVNIMWCIYTYVPQKSDVCVAHMSKCTYCVGPTILDLKSIFCGALSIYATESDVSVAHIDICAIEYRLTTTTYHNLFHSRSPSLSSHSSSLPFHFAHTYLHLRWHHPYLPHLLSSSTSLFVHYFLSNTPLSHHSLVSASNPLGD
jgi:hypothetical protein